VSGSPVAGRGAELLPNLGAEEGRDWRRAATAPSVIASARLWRLLFADPARVVGPDPRAADPIWPEGLGPPAELPIFSWLENTGRRVPWLSTRAAAAESGELEGCDPELVEHVHDKAFAHRFALAEGYLPRSLRERIAVFEPDELRQQDSAVARLNAELASWPAWASARFVLKPRFGSSGRGRVAGVEASADTPELRGSLERLAACGGALLEPWLDRSVDLSAQLHLPAASSEEIVLLGTLEQLLAPSGLYRGHRGQMDSRGRVFSGHAREEELREAAAAVARAARAQGYVGPCGVDAFEFRVPGPDPDPVSGGAPGGGLDVGDGLEFRPIVEFNARYTVGLIVLGLTRRALPILKQALELQPGTRLHFVFALSSPVEAWSDATRRAAPHAHLILLDDPEAEVCPALLFGREPGLVDELASSVACEGRPGAA